MAGAGNKVLERDPDPPPLGASYGGFVYAEAPFAKAEK
jgi:hypothetical protein